MEPLTQSLIQRCHRSNLQRGHSPSQHPARPPRRPFAAVPSCFQQQQQQQQARAWGLGLGSAGALFFFLQLHHHHTSSITPPTISVPAYLPAAAAAVFCARRGSLIGLPPVTQSCLYSLQAPLRYHPSSSSSPPYCMLRLFAPRRLLCPSTFLASLQPSSSPQQPSRLFHSASTRQFQLTTFKMTGTATLGGYSRKHKVTIVGSGNW